MPFQAVPNGIQAKLLMTQNGVRMVNIWNIDNLVAVTPGALANVGNIIDAWLTSDYSILMSTSVKYDQIIVTDLSVPNGGQDIRVPTTPNGANGTAVIGGNTAMVASLRTAKTGRNFRGRTYMPGLQQGDLQDAQHATVVFAAAVNGHFVNLIALLAAGSAKLCVLSRYLNNAVRAVGLLTEVIAVITDTKLDSQSRRTAN